MKKTRFFLLLTVFSFSILGPGASDVWARVWSRPDYFTFMTGYMVEDDLERKDDYEIIPLEFSLGWGLNNWIERHLNWDIPGKLNGELELSINPVLSPDSNVEAVFNVALMWFPFGEGKISPYLKGGTGPGYTTQHTYEQGSQANFFSYAGIGLQIKVNRKCSVLVGYRVRHFSNADLDKPNKGVNHEGWVSGVKIRF